MIIPYSTLIIDDELGKGEFGKVLVGQWKGHPVAIKYCKEEADLKEFYKEANIMLYVLETLTSFT
jgi:predicted Ser/Thr protein kinase